jgi:GNAT superfamily N-acetyltransferase
MIRKMTETDFPIVLVLCTRMYEETTTYRHFQFCATRIMEILKLAVTQGFAVLAITDGLVVGFMAACAVNPAFSRDFMACDYALYVLPEYRGGMSAFRLVKEYISWAKESGVKLITVGVTAGIDNAKAIEFYKSAGFRESGTQLSMEV